MNRLAVLLVIATCESPMSCVESDTPEGEFTQSLCPPTDPPTYDNFGRAFMETFCTRCHDSAKPTGMRGDAPLGVDFDTRTKLRLWTSNIDREAAIGPASANRTMPPDGPMPTDAERRRLGEYIACEVAN